MDDVDHVIPMRGNLTLMRAGWNLQSLCRQCHAKKTGRDRGWSDLTHPLPTRDPRNVIVLAGPPMAWRFLPQDLLAGREIVELEDIYRGMGIIPAFVTTETTRFALAERNRRLESGRMVALVVGAPREVDRRFWADVWGAAVLVSHPPIGALLAEINSLASDWAERAVAGLKAYLAAAEPVGEDEIAQVFGERAMQGTDDGEGGV